MYVLHELSSTSILNLCMQKDSDKAAFLHRLSSGIAFAYRPGTEFL